MTSPWDGKTKWAIGKTTKLNNDKPLKICENGLHLYTSLDNITIGSFGPRVFEAEPIGEVAEAESKICCRSAKLIREVDPGEVRDSEWAYEYCLNIDRPSVRKNITDSGWAYRYCLDIKDLSSVRKYITDSGWAYEYCLGIKDRPEVRKHVKVTK